MFPRSGAFSSGKALGISSLGFMLHELHELYGELEELDEFAGGSNTNPALHKLY